MGKKSGKGKKKKPEHWHAFLPKFSEFPKGVPLARNQVFKMKVPEGHFRFKLTPLIGLTLPLLSPNI